VATCRIHNAAHTMNTSTSLTANVPVRWGLPPAHVLRAYLIGCVPLFLVYMLANETDGDFSRGFNVVSALGGTLRNAGPAFVLLLPVWAYTGWLEKRGFGVTRVLLNHAGMAMVFAGATQAASFLLIALWRDWGAAFDARNRWFIWQGMFVMLMYWAAAGGFTAYRAVQKARAEAAATAQAQTLLARTELAALRNKLNPHFLFNTLHSIIALTRRDGPRAEKALLMFSDMLRYVLHTEKSGVDHVPLQQELDFTRDYLALEALRLGPRLTVDWQLDDTVLGVPVPALCVQPLVENSIKHAFSPRSEPGRLTIKVSRLQNPAQLRVEVADNGPGCTPESLSGGSGLGLKTVSRRLILQYGETAALRTDSQPGAGFAVSFKLPLDI
jgi:signal transduction histidine kinase